jgi:four helix bundle protein
MDVADQAYEVTTAFPSDERYGLSQQMRRAAVSIPANVAEGHARRSLRAYLNHLGIALGSLAELDTELEVAERRGYVNADASHDLRRNIDRSRQIVHGLRRSLEVRLFAGFGTVLCLASAILALVNL